MTTTTLELDLIRTQTKELLLREIIESFSSQFWESSRETMLVLGRLSTKHAEHDYYRKHLLDKIN